VCMVATEASMRTATLAALLCLSLIGCDWSMHVKAEILVEPAAQRAIGSWPQQALLRHGQLEEGAPTTAGVHRIAVLCEPSTEPVVLNWDFDALNGCGKAADITVWIEQLDPASELECGPRNGPGQRVDGRWTPPEGAPSATGRVFEGSGRCLKEDTIALAIGAPTP
jgi:hypothetical protein